MSPAPHPNAEFIAEVHAKAADQFLLSYLALTRFPESSPNSLGFALGHCLELSIKTAFWQRKRRAPKFKHFMDELIEQLPADLQRALNRILPSTRRRRRFKFAIRRLHKAPTIEMLKTYFNINPNS